jgi:predicted nucleotidyltransferase
LSSSVLAWPDSREVRAAVEAWARAVAAERPEVVAVGYFGSYARGDWGVGSDVDLVVVVESSDVPFDRRASGWDATGLPVPADVLVYTETELERLVHDGGRFARVITDEVAWVVGRPPTARRGASG